MNDFDAYIGLDVHKDTIAVAVATAGRGRPRFLCELRNEAGERVAKVGGRIEAAVSEWSRRPLVEALVALRGIDFLTASILAAELGDITRFDSPRQLMAFVGLVPGEHSSDGKRRPGAITRTGNAHARRVLVEAA